MTNARQHYPSDLFADPESLAAQPWTCVCTRPRWEKKFAQWLEIHQMAYFLPLIARRTVSHRKVRITDNPLFPGYVFVRGLHTRQTFAVSGCMVRLLTPRSDPETVQLTADILAVYRMLIAGDHPALVPQWTTGQRVRVLLGPLEGTVGQFIRDDGQGRLIVWIDLLGVGASVTLPPDTPLEPDD